MSVDKRLKNIEKGIAINFWEIYAYANFILLYLSETLFGDIMFLFFTLLGLYKLFKLSKNDL